MPRKITVQVDLIIDDDETPEEAVAELHDCLHGEFYEWFIVSKGCEVREMWS